MLICSKPRVGRNKAKVKYSADGMTVAYIETKGPFVSIDKMIDMLYNDLNIGFVKTDTEDLIKYFETLKLDVLQTFEEGNGDKN